MGCVKSDWSSCRANVLRQTIKYTNFAFLHLPPIPISYSRLSLLYHTPHFTDSENINARTFHTDAHTQTHARIYIYMRIYAINLTEKRAFVFH